MPENEASLQLLSDDAMKNVACEDCRTRRSREDRGAFLRTTTSTDPAKWPAWYFLPSATLVRVLAQDGIVVEDSESSFSFDAVSALDGGRGDNLKRREWSLESCAVDLVHYPWREDSGIFDKHHGR